MTIKGTLLLNNSVLSIQSKKNLSRFGQNVDGFFENLEIYIKCSNPKKAHPWVITRF